jgi:hypothetical protein
MEIISISIKHNSDSIVSGDNGGGGDKDGAEDIDEMNN